MKYLIIFTLYLVVFTNGQKITGGNPAPVSKYPFAVALLTNSGVGSFQQNCGGTIVTTTAVLSAASCFITDENEDPAMWWRVRVGSSYPNSGGSIYFINRITVHPEYAALTKVHDVAVLRTNIEILFTTSLVEAAYIAGGSYPLTEEQPIWAIGWQGVNEEEDTIETLHDVQLYVVNQQLCATQYQSVGFTVTSNMVCVGWIDVGVTAQCEAGFGSPLVDNGIVVGVYTQTEGCAELSIPSINTRVSAYTRWIVATARE